MSETERLAEININHKNPLFSIGLSTPKYTSKY